MFREIDDYVEQIKVEFPTLSEKAIKNILKFGWRMYYHVNKYGCDVLVKDDINRKFTAFTGFLYKDPLLHYNHGLKKWRFKDRMMHYFKQTPWDGYYYFGLTEERAEELNTLLSNNKKRVIYLENIFYYKHQSEVYFNHAFDFIYRIKYPMDIGNSFYMKKKRVNKHDLSYVGINNESTCHKKKQQTPLQKV